MEFGYSSTTPVGGPERAFNHMKVLLSFIERRIDVDFGV